MRKDWKTFYPSIDLAYETPYGRDIDVTVWFRPAHDDFGVIGFEFDVVKDSEDPMTEKELVDEKKCIDNYVNGDTWHHNLLN